MYRVYILLTKDVSPTQTPKLWRTEAQFPQVCSEGCSRGIRVGDQIVNKERMTSVGLKRSWGHKNCEQPMLREPEGGYTNTGEVKVPAGTTIEREAAPSTAQKTSRINQELPSSLQCYSTGSYPPDFLSPSTPPPLASSFPYVAFVLPSIVAVLG